MRHIYDGKKPVVTKPATFGEFLKRHRISLGLSLRQFCQKNKLDPANVSKMERNLLPPPKDKRLRAYAEALSLVKGGGAWLDFFDLAAAAKGEFPADLRDDELLPLLPALFCTMRNDPQKFINLLRKR